MIYNVEDIVATSCVMELSISSEVTIKQCYSIIATCLLRHAYKNHSHAFRKLSFHEFSDNEMNDFVEFYHRNCILQAIGFYDSSAIFLALKKNLRIIVTDNVTKNICKQLDIGIIDLKDIQEHTSNQNTTDLSNKFNTDKTSLEINDIKSLSQSKIYRDEFYKRLKTIQ